MKENIVGRGPDPIPIDHDLGRTLVRDLVRDQGREVLADSADSTTGRLTTEELITNLASSHLTIKTEALDTTTSVAMMVLSVFITIKIKTDLTTEGAVIISTISVIIPGTEVAA